MLTSFAFTLSRRPLNEEQMLPHYTLQFETITPIWTGDADEKSHLRLLETGIVGSLRWWAEAIARAAGHDVEVSSISNPIEQVFGNTEGRRQFRIVIRRSELVPNEVQVPTFLPPPDEKGRVTFRLPKLSKPTEDSVWEFGSQAQFGRFQIELTLATPEMAERIFALIDYASRWGGIGARQQSGCGLIRIVDPKPDFHSQSPEEILDAWFGGRVGSTPTHELPTLTEFFFQEFAVPPECPPIEDFTPQHWPFLLRQRIRRAFDGWPQQNLRHRLCGEGGSEPHGAHIFISFPFQRTIDDAGRVVRVRGWLPARGMEGVSCPFLRDRIAAVILRLDFQVLPNQAAEHAPAVLGGVRPHLLTSGENKA